MKRILIDILPALCEGIFTAIFGRISESVPRSRSRRLFFWGSSGAIVFWAMMLTGLIWPLSAPAQAPAPPPVHAFDPETGTNAADDDELILTDWFILDEGSSPTPSPMPSLPPGVTPAVSEPAVAPPPPTVPASPAVSSPSTDSGPPAGPPLVNLPPIPGPAPKPAEIPSPAPTQAEAVPVAPVPALPIQAQKPPESVPPVQVPAGYTPLPTVPLQSAPEPLPDPFALPPAAEPKAPAPNLAAPADSLTVPLGQVQSVPAPQWGNADPETTPSQSQVISGAPLPQFDASQSHWIQLEIGQGDGSGQAPAAARPTSVYSLPDPAAKPLEPAPAPAQATVEAATDQALDQAISQPPAAGRNYNSPDGREHLRNLFPEFTSPESLGARAPAAGSPASGGQTPASAGTAPKTEPAGSAPAQATPDKTDEEVGSSAILKAGGLLTVDEQFGAAEILPPLSGRPRWPAPETQAPAKPPVPDPTPKAASAKPEPPVVSPAVKAAPAKTALRPEAKPAQAKSSGSGQAKKGGSKKAAARAPATPAGVGLMIINETGRDRVGQQYRSVLAQMGYKVVSAGEGRPGRGPAGQTVINYRPGLKAQAQAVARHLPGKKVLSEAKKGQVLASEIMIYIR